MNMFNILIISYICIILLSYNVFSHLLLNDLLFVISLLLIKSRLLLISNIFISYVSNIQYVIGYFYIKYVQSDKFSSVFCYQKVLKLY